jgi:hypothetical protein
LPPRRKRGESPPGPRRVISPDSKSSGGINERPAMLSHRRPPVHDRGNLSRNTGLLPSARLPLG